MCSVTKATQAFYWSLTRTNNIDTAYQLHENVKYRDYENALLLS